MNRSLIEVERPDGHVAVEVSGHGPLILCVPGMGENRASFRHLVPLLVSAGARVAVMDLRGHGDSSAGFSSYDDPATAGDLLAVIDALGSGPATVVGNSMGAAAAVIAAADRPAAISRLVLIGPFVRDHGPAGLRTLMRLMLLRPWGPAVWRGYAGSLFGKIRPDDHEEQFGRTMALLRRPGRWRAFQATVRDVTHAPAEAALPRVDAPTLVIMGSRDRDFPDPEAEASWIAVALGGEHRMIPGAGHYPMAEQPDAVFAEIHGFLSAEASHG